MTLTYNHRTSDFVLTTEDKVAAEAAGLTLSTAIRGSAGEPVYFTKEQYAALPFWREADDRAKEKLGRLWADYAASWAEDASIHIPLPAHAPTPMRFQRAGVAYALGRPNTLIGDAPGLGKSGQAVMAANVRGAERVLVLCPASIRLNWQREIRKWSAIPNVTTYPILRGGHGVNPYVNYVICSYDLARNDGIHEALCAVDWDMVIVDESHMLKTTGARRTQAVFGGGRGRFKTDYIVKDVANVVALTGTPLPNRPRECYTMARALCWDSVDWMSYEEFCYRFNPSGRLANGHVLEMRGRLPELQARLRCNFMVRRLKEDVLKDLPDKRYELAYVEPNGAIKEILAREKLIQFSPEDLKDPFSEIWGQISTLRREMGEAMVPRIVEHARYLLDIMELPKIVLFSHHHVVMDRVREALRPYGVVEVRGGLSPERKQEAVDEFVADPCARVFSGQIEAAGVGIDGLQHVASWVVITEPAWTPGTNEQAVDRTHRIGQHQNVVAQFLVVEGSLVERILAKMLDKVHTIHDSLDRSAR